MGNVQRIGVSRSFNWRRNWHEINRRSITTLGVSRIKSRHCKDRQDTVVRCNRVVKNTRHSDRAIDPLLVDKRQSLLDRGPASIYHRRGCDRRDQMWKSGYGVVIVLICGGPSIIIVAMSHTLPQMFHLYQRYPSSRKLQFDALLREALE